MSYDPSQELRIQEVLRRLDEMVEDDDDPFCQGLCDIAHVIEERRQEYKECFDPDKRERLKDEIVDMLEDADEVVHKVRELAKELRGETPHD